MEDHKLLEKINSHEFDIEYNDGDTLEFEGRDFIYVVDHWEFDSE